MASKRATFFLIASILVLCLTAVVTATVGATTTKALLVVQSSDGDTIFEQQVSSDKPVSTNVGEKQRIVVRFRVADGSNKPFSPQQAFVRFASSGFEHIVVGEPVKNNEYNYVVKVVDELPSGKYDVTVLVGDAQLASATIFKVGQVSVTSNVAATERASDKLYAPRAEIHHKFRTPAARPSLFMSQLFTGAVLAPLGLLVIGLLRLRANVSSLPTSPMGLLSSLGMLALLAAIMLLLAAYWVKLTLFPTLGFLSVLGLAAVFIGRRALQYHASSKSD